MMRTLDRVSTVARSDLQVLETQQKRNRAKAVRVQGRI